MRQVNKLTEATIRHAPPKPTTYRLSDGKGLGLLINPDGSKWWRFRYRFGLKQNFVRGRNRAKEKHISFGVFPEVTLAEARRRCSAARGLLRDGIDPGAQRKLDRLATANTVHVVAQELFAAFETASLEKGILPLAPNTILKNRQRVEKYVFPRLGSRPIRLVTVPELFAVLKTVQDMGKYETCKRLRQWCHKIWRYAVVTGRAAANIVLEMRGAFIPVRSESHAAITSPHRVGELLRAIDGYTGQRVTALALRLEPYLFSRHIELRMAEWVEFDLREGWWRIPGKRMKMRDAHEIPLSRQALAILGELRALTGGRRYLFPSIAEPDLPMSANTLTEALRALGFDGDEMTVQGFRTLASTLLNEAGIDPGLIELQLAHLERDTSRRAYNHAKRLGARRMLMQLWADALDALRAGTRPPLWCNSVANDGQTESSMTTPDHYEDLMAPEVFPARSRLPPGQ